MKYSKAIAVAVAALSVMSLAAAVDTVVPANPCTKGELVINGACAKAPDALPAFTEVKKIEATADEKKANADAHRDTLVCVDHAAPKDAKDISQGCLCTTTANGNACTAPAPPTCMEVKNATRYADLRDGKYCCQVGTKKDGEKCIVDKSVEEGCAGILDRKWVVGTDGKGVCEMLCKDGYNMTMNPKDTSKPLSERCFKKNQYTAAECAGNQTVTHRNLTAEGDCVCLPGFKPELDEDLYSKDACVDNAASAIIMSSAAVLAFLGSVAFLI